MRVNQFSVIGWDGFRFLRSGEVRADRLQCQRDDRVVQVSCSEEIRTQANDRPQVFYMEAAGDSCAEFLFHSRLISSISRKFSSVKIATY